jgi:hypothetical protein
MKCEIQKLNFIFCSWHKILQDHHPLRRGRARADGEGLPDEERFHKRHERWRAQGDGLLG